MDIRSMQLMIQNQAMSIMMSDRDANSYHSPLTELTFKQLLQNKIDQASSMNRPSFKQMNTYAQNLVQHTSIKEQTIQRSEFDHMISNIANKYGIDEQLIHAIIKVESNYNIYANSSAGAQGLMQLMPQTARGLGVTNPFDPEQNIEGGVKYLKQMLNRYNENIDIALAAYNAGPGNVDKYQGIPPFKETKNYIQKVLNNYYT